MGWGEALQWETQSPVQAAWGGVGAGVGVGEKQGC